jgi:hypothetical protein
MLWNHSTILNFSQFKQLKNDSVNTSLIQNLIENYLL